MQAPHRSASLPARAPCCRSSPSSDCQPCGVVWANPRVASGMLPAPGATSRPGGAPSVAPRCDGRTSTGGSRCRSCDPVGSTSERLRTEVRKRRSLPRRALGRRLLGGPLAPGRRSASRLVDLQAPPAHDSDAEAWSDSPIPKGGLRRCLALVAPADPREVQVWPRLAPPPGLHVRLRPRPGLSVSHGDTEQVLETLRSRGSTSISCLLRTTDTRPVSRFQTGSPLSPRRAGPRSGARPGQRHAIHQKSDLSSRSCSP